MTLRNQVDDDRLKLFPKEQQSEYLRQCDMRDGGVNDAQLVAEMRREGTLKTLDPDRYGLPSVRVGQTEAVEKNAGYGYRAGDHVVVKEHYPWATIDESHRVVAVLEGRAIRCEDGHVYPIHEVRHATE